MILRNFKKEDAPIIAEWLRSEEELYKWSADRFNKYPLTGEDINENYAPQIESGRFYPLTAVDENETIVGHFIIRYPRDDDDSSVRFGFVIVNPAIRGKGYGKELLQLGIGYVKEHLSAKRIDLGVFENNESARYCYEAVGFTEYAKRECEMPIGTWKCTDMEMFIEKSLETERLILRRWEESDGEDLYKYASNPDVGPIAGWAVHTSVENSREIIKGVLSEPVTYAVVLKETGHPVGSIGLMLGKASNIGIPDTEGEIGYWIGVPYWGQGLIPEAVREIMRYGFEELNLEKLWCGYFDGNEKSKRVQEKCGFHYHHTSENVPCALEGVLRTEHITCLTKEEWLEKR